MKIVPIYLWDHSSYANENDGLSGPPDQPALRQMLEQRGIRLRVNSLLNRIISSARVLIIEGISGSGKDTLQAYLKKMLVNRIVYDYSEGEVLHSWKQLQISGILQLRVRFMKLFVEHVEKIIRTDERAVFLLNRFHLSTYASTIVPEPNLENEYNQVIENLKTLPVHIIILQLDESEIEKRSSHRERSAAWQKFQQQIDPHSFRERLERQQKLILEAASRQQIPYSVVKLVNKPQIKDGQPLTVNNLRSHRSTTISARK